MSYDHSLMLPMISCCEFMHLFYFIYASHIAPPLNLLMQVRDLSALLRSSQGVLSTRRASEALSQLLQVGKRSLYYKEKVTLPVLI